VSEILVQQNYILPRSYGRRRGVLVIRPCPRALLGPENDAGLQTLHIRDGIAYASSYIGRSMRGRGD
jgi:hypothetical protein